MVKKEYAVKVYIRGSREDAYRFSKHVKREHSREVKKTKVVRR